MVFSQTRLNHRVNGGLHRGNGESNVLRFLRACLCSLCGKKANPYTKDLM
jgi:hypothetical protein